MLPMGYLLYDIEYEGRPLALISSANFIEYTRRERSRKWLDKVERVVGKRRDGDEPGQAAVGFCRVFIFGRCRRNRRGCR